MMSLRGLGANTATGVVYTDEEILAIVTKGKRRGHIVVRGRRLVDSDMSKVAAVTRECRATRRDLYQMFSILRSNPQFTELVSQIASSSRIGEASGSGSGNGEGERQQG
ncbi:hypothetical protein Tco_1579896, partial [Tanacetum coccineum]